VRVRAVFILMFDVMEEQKIHDEAQTAESAEIAYSTLYQFTEGEGRDALAVADFVSIFIPSRSSMYFMFSSSSIPTTALLVFLSVAPGLLIAWFVYTRDRYDKEPRHLLVWSFVLGMFGVIPPVVVEMVLSMFGFDKSQSVVHLFAHAFFVVALVEEATKFAVLRSYAYTKPDFDEPFDGITYSVMIAMGFATVENMMYVLANNAAGPSFQTALWRMFTAVPAHAANGILMGYYTGLAKFSRHESPLLFTAFMAALVAHGLYDFFIFLNRPGLIIFGAFAVLVVVITLSLRAMRLHSMNSPFRKDA
jgi:RsiW-degrading membrane proteinase PrsW (M82 family)